ncbi:hypothetical protein [Streptomyces sp. c-19]|uniref:hypothetical protein n=1 Tax=Streptomyces sp. c-19 TaxID=2789275 RepID=UPI0039817F7B
MAPGAADGGRAFGDIMSLASSGGAWWKDDVRAERDEDQRAVASLDKVATHLRDTTSTDLGQAAFDVAELRASGSLGAVIAAGFGPIVDDLVLATRALGNHLTGPLSDAITAAAADQKRVDEDLRERFGFGR